MFTVYEITVKGNNGLYLNIYRRYIGNILAKCGSKLTVISKISNAKRRHHSRQARLRSPILLLQGHVALNLRRMVFSQDWQLSCCFSVPCIFHDLSPLKVVVAYVSFLIPFPSSQVNVRLPASLFRRIGLTLRRREKRPA